MISTFRNDLDAKRSPPSLTVNDRLVNDKRPTRKAASSQSINCWRLLAWLRGSLPPAQVKNEGDAETCLLSPYRCERSWRSRSGLYQDVGATGLAPQSIRKPGLT